MRHLLFLNKVKDKFEPETIKTVVESIALCVVNYCLPLLRRVHQLQHFAAKICAGGARRSAPATPFITQLKWLKMDKKNIFDVAIHVFKVKVNVFPEWYIHLPTHTDVSHQNNTTRHQHRLHVPLTHTDSGGRSLIVLGPRVWNALPPNGVNCNTLSSFKKHLREFLMNNDVTQL